MNNPKHGTTALTLAGCCALTMACAGSAPSAPAPLTASPAKNALDPQPQFFAADCSLEPNGDAAPEFEVALARRALRAARARAAQCQGKSENDAQVPVKLTWGPSGCVRVVELSEGAAGTLTDGCVIEAFRQATLPAFSGHPVRAVDSSEGVQDEFSRVGTMAPEVIQSVVRASFGQFRTCYEEGLGRDRKLHGTVRVWFEIPDSGIVSRAVNQGSDLPDPRVIECVINRFLGMRFPSPTGGTVTVVYPIALAPG
jgi:hypothetical protein